jgi:ribosome modulation factor
MKRYYDYDYFEGKDLRYPAKPSKPVLTRDPTAAEARAYANSLEGYERDLCAYQEDRDQYDREMTMRGQKLHDRIRDDYDITEDQFLLLWARAHDDGHSESLHRVVEIFEELYELATQFAALEK